MSMRWLLMLPSTMRPTLILESHRGDECPLTIGPLAIYGRAALLEY
jgi:hypothetical protein